MRVVVGISGASGFRYGIAVLRLLKQMNVEVHLVITCAGHINREHETRLNREDVNALADVVYDNADIGSAIASGSFRSAGMIIAPCSIHTLAAIANGLTSNLLTRAADVMLKERRKLVLMVRETPLHIGHIRNMLQVTEAGGIVFPPMPAMYANPQSIEEILTHSAARALSLLNLDWEPMPRWGENLTLIKKDKTI